MVGWVEPNALLDSDTLASEMLTPEQFRDRYVAAIPGNVPPELRAELAEFIELDAGLVAALGLSEVDHDILVQVGLPRTAPPNLFFGGDRVDLLAPLDGAPGKIIVGANMFGDVVCLDLDNHGAVVEVNNDSRSQSSVMNASIVSLAHCLCAFAEFRTTKDAHAFQTEIAQVDAVAAADDSWWMREIAVRSR